MKKNITRGTFLKTLATGSMAIPFINTKCIRADNPSDTPKKKKNTKRILHITDVHLRPDASTAKAKEVLKTRHLTEDFQAEKRCRNIVNKIFENHGDAIDLILNGGDCIWAADHGYITKEEALYEWEAWDRSVIDLIRKSYDGAILSTIGNHDIWWGGPEKIKEDALFGKDFVVKKLSMPNRYYSQIHFNWKFIVLDCNNRDILDDEQFAWYQNEIVTTPKDQPVIILTHQPIAYSDSLISGGMNERQQSIIFPWKEDKDIHARKVYFLSGHQHILDAFNFKNIGLHCNGSISGWWWDYKDKGSQGNCSCNGTPMGYTLIDIEENGALRCRYFDVTDVKDGVLLV